MNGVKKKKGIMSKYTFLVVLWDEPGNKQLFRKMVSVKRINQFAAKEYLRKKYPKPYYIELDSAIHYK
jgi:hypothetical protein